MISPTTWEIMANIVLFSHLLFLVYICTSLIYVYGFGGMKRNPRYYNFHVSVVIVMVISQLIFGGCPLSTLECALRHQYIPNYTHYGSFTVSLIAKYIGINIPVLLVAIVTYFVVALAIVTKLSQTFSEQKK